MNVILTNSYSLTHSHGMDIANQLDQAMRSYDNNKGISQAALAALSKVPQPTISRTLKGNSIPETKTLIKLARALNCTLGGYSGTEHTDAIDAAGLYITDPKLVAIVRMIQQAEAPYLVDKIQKDLAADIELIARASGQVKTTGG